MADVVEAVTVDRSPNEVWGVLAEFDKIAGWASNVDHSSFTTNGAVGVGTVRRVQVGRNALLEEIREWEPNDRLVYSIDGLPPVVRSVTNTWQLNPIEAGTEITLTSSIDAGPRPPQKVAARLFGRAMAKASATMLAGLAQHLSLIHI